jgi:hypothetical protein
MNCLDIVYYIPSRKVALDRKPTTFTLAVTNYDMCLEEYWLIGEVDNPKLDIDLILRKYEDVIAFITKTPKGYHIYTNVHHRNPLKVVHLGYKLKFLDRGHLKIGKRRRSHYLALRVWGKYEDNPYVVPIVINDENLSEWHYQVLQLIRDSLISPLMDMFATATLLSLLGGVE